MLINHILPTRSSTISTAYTSYISYTAFSTFILPLPRYICATASLVRAKLRTIKYLYCFTDMILVLFRIIFGFEPFKEYTEYISRVQKFSFRIFLTILSWNVDKILHIRRCVCHNSHPRVLCVPPGAHDLILATIWLC